MFNSLFFYHLTDRASELLDLQARRDILPALCNLAILIVEPCLWSVVQKCISIALFEIKRQTGMAMRRD